MDRALPETIKLADYLLSENQLQTIQKVLKEIKQNSIKYNTDLFWELDATIGGIGGYCMPVDPVKNPFPGGIEREFFRPLQYVRSEIDMCNINHTARYVIQYSGMHLESVVRFALKKNSRFGSLRHFSTTLGKAVKTLDKSDIFPKRIINALYLFIPLFNKSKHEINKSMERTRLFTPSDALIAYICARILGYEILKNYYPFDFKIISNSNIS